MSEFKIGDKMINTCFSGVAYCANWLTWWRPCNTEKLIPKTS